MKRINQILAIVVFAIWIATFALIEQISSRISALKTEQEKAIASIDSFSRHLEVLFRSCSGALETPSDSQLEHRGLFGSGSTAYSDKKRQTKGLGK